MSSCAEWVSMASDVSVAVAAGVGAIVAWRGLGAWRQQLKGSNEYELARRMLKATYQLRDAMAAARTSAMFGSEMPAPTSEQATGKTPDQIRYFGISGAYSERYRLVQSHRATLDADLLEAEALWGAEVKLLYRPLFKLQHQLWVAIYTYLRSIDPDIAPSSRASHNRIFLDKYNDVMYDQSEGDEKPDPFTSGVLTAITAVEDVLRPHLARSKSRGKALIR